MVNCSPSPSSSPSLRSVDVSGLYRSESDGDGPDRVGGGGHQLATERLDLDLVGERLGSGAHGAERPAGLLEVAVRQPERRDRRTAATRCSASSTRPGESTRKSNVLVRLTSRDRMSTSGLRTSVTPPRAAPRVVQRLGVGARQPWTDDAGQHADRDRGRDRGRVARAHARRARTPTIRPAAAGRAGRGARTRRRTRWR